MDADAVADEILEDVISFQQAEAAVV